MGQKGCRGGDQLGGGVDSLERDDNCSPGRGHSTAAKLGRKERARHFGGIQLDLWPEHREGRGGAGKENEAIS